MPATPRTPILSRRARITQGLATVVAETGYRDSKIQSVAAAAHVSLTTIYKEFDNKEAILLELHEVAIGALIDALQAAVVFDRDWKDVIRGAFTRYFQLVAEHPRLTYAIVVELATLSDAASASREQAIERLSDTLCELVERGRIAYPGIPSRPLSRPMARAVLGGVNELVVGQATGATRWPLSELAATATDLLWGAVVA